MDAEKKSDHSNSLDDINTLYQTSEFRPIIQLWNNINTFARYVKVRHITYSKRDSF